MNKSFAIAGIVGGLAIAAVSGGIGYAAKPAEVVTVEKPVEKIVEKTPASCAEALETAEKVFASSAKVIGYGQDAVVAAASFDAAGIMKQRGLVDVETGVIKSLTPKYQSARANCLG